MDGYFQPLRRKIGVVILLMALVLTGGWIRSFSFQDGFLFPSGQNTKDSFFSVAGTLVWIRYDETLTVPPRSSGMFIRRFVGRPFADPDIKWRWRLCGFGDASEDEYRMWTVAYRSIVVPLTLLSAWLLLSKPRKSSNNKPAQPERITAA